LRRYSGDIGDDELAGDDGDDMSWEPTRDRETDDDSGTAARGCDAIRGIDTSAVRTPEQHATRSCESEVSERVSE
jgi:hypothetical protein